MKHLATLLLGIIIGAALTPVAHADAIALEGKLERCARAAERIAAAVEKASR